MKKYELDTPSLVLDIDRFDYNLNTMRALASRYGKKLRPHAKTHKCPEITKRQIAAGNCARICVAKVSEANRPDNVFRCLPASTDHAFLCNQHGSPCY